MCAHLRGIRAAAGPGEWRWRASVRSATAIRKLRHSLGASAVVERQLEQLGDPRTALRQAATSSFVFRYLVPIDRSHGLQLLCRFRSLGRCRALASLVAVPEHRGFRCCRALRGLHTAVVVGRETVDALTMQTRALCPAAAQAKSRTPSSAGPLSFTNVSFSYRKQERDSSLLAGPRRSAAQRRLGGLGLHAPGRFPVRLGDACTDANTNSATVF
jgi:hypothetical protein